MQPLHVFEPRYRDLLEDALAGDRLVTMGVLSPGWEDDYEGRPPVWPIGCLGRVAVCHRLDGGAYNVLLVALRRVRLVQELPPTKRFREALAEVCEDCYPPPTRPGPPPRCTASFATPCWRSCPSCPRPRTSSTTSSPATCLGNPHRHHQLYAGDRGSKPRNRYWPRRTSNRRAEALLEHLARVGRHEEPAGSVASRAVVRGNRARASRRQREAWTLLDRDDALPLEGICAIASSLQHLEREGVLDGGALKDIPNDVAGIGCASAVSRSAQRQRSVSASRMCHRPHARRPRRRGLGCRSGMTERSSILQAPSLRTFVRRLATFVGGSFGSSKT